MRVLCSDMLWLHFFIHLVLLVCSNSEPLHESQIQLKPSRQFYHHPKTNWRSEHLDAPFVDASAAGEQETAGTATSQKSKQNSPPLSGGDLESVLKSKEQLKRLETASAVFENVRLLRGISNTENGEIKNEVPESSRYRIRAGEDSLSDTDDWARSFDETTGSESNNNQKPSLLIFESGGVSNLKDEELIKGLDKFSSAEKVLEDDNETLGKQNKYSFPLNSGDLEGSFDTQQVQQQQQVPPGHHRSNLQQPSNASSFDFIPILMLNELENPLLNRNSEGAGGEHIETSGPLLDSMKQDWQITSNDLQSARAVEGETNRGTVETQKSSEPDDFDEGLFLLKTGVLILGLSLLIFGGRKLVTLMKQNNDYKTAWKNAYASRYNRNPPITEGSHTVLPSIFGRSREPEYQAL